MQIGKSGRNSGLPGVIHETHERPGAKNGGFVPGDSFQDRLQKSMQLKPGVISPNGFRPAGIQPGWCDSMQDAQEVEVRRIPYSACDKMEINILEGYTLKAKLEKEPGQTRACSVYVEMKEENGTMKAYLFDADKIQKNSSSAMERIAYEAVESLQKEDAASEVKWKDAAGKAKKEDAAGKVK